MSDPLQRKHGPNSGREASRRGARESSQRPRRLHPTLKHGGYSGMTLLPGEDPAEFQKLHQELIAEYVPVGRHEYDIVETIARLMWRKQCLWTYGLAEFARQRYSAIKLEQERWQTNRTVNSTKGLFEEEMQKMREQEARAVDDYMELFVKLQKSPQYQQQVEKQKLEREHIQRELGAVAFELAKIPHVATTGYLMHELSIIDRIDGMIDRCLKRLLLVRGVKSISPSASAAPKRIAASVSPLPEVKNLPSSGG
jgi:hypothetical protein